MEEIDDSVSSNPSLLMYSTSNKEQGSINHLITESNISKAAIFSTASKELESTPTEFDGQWAQHIRTLIIIIEEVADD